MDNDMKYAKLQASLEDFGSEDASIRLESWIKNRNCKARY